MDKKFDRPQRPARDDGNERQQQETTDGGDSRLGMRTAVAAANNGGSRWLRRTTMGMDNDSTQELATNNNGQGIRLGGKQKWHLAFITGNNCYVKLARMPPPSAAGTS